MTYSLSTLLAFAPPLDSAARLPDRLAEEAGPFGWFFELGVSIAGHRITIGQVTVAIAVMWGAILFSRVLRGWLRRRVFTPRKVDEGMQVSIGSLLHYFLITIGAAAAISAAGFDLSGLAFVAGALSVGIGFGLQNIVQNFVSGLILLFERPVRVGDSIEIDEARGEVRKIGLRSTMVTTVDGAEVLVPNSRLIAEPVTNWTLGSREARLVLPVSVPSDVDPAQALEVLLEAARTVPTDLADPRASAVAVGFGANSVELEVRLWLADADHVPAARSQLVLEVLSRFKRAGIPLAVPVQEVRAGLGEQPKGDVAEAGPLL